MKMEQRALSSVIAVIVAETTPVINNVYSLHLPPIVLEVFQCIAWGSAFVIAAVTILKYIRNGNKDQTE